jgi:RNA polymerase sigma-70 factor (ECF subfamily)
MLTERTSRDVRGCDARRSLLFRRHRQAVLAYCRRFLGSSHAAEDASQEIFLRLSCAPDRVPTGEDELRWIYRVAANYCLNQLRNSRLRRQRSAEWGVLVQLRGQPADPSVGSVVRDLLPRIPYPLRLVAWLYHVDGWEQTEIARLLGICRRTVVTRLAQFTAAARWLLRDDAEVIPRKRS